MQSARSAHSTSSCVFSIPAEKMQIRTRDARQWDVFFGPRDILQPDRVTIFRFSRDSFGIVLITWLAVFTVGSSLSVVTGSAAGPNLLEFRFEFEFESLERGVRILGISHSNAAFGVGESEPHLWCTYQSLKIWNFECNVPKESIVRVFKFKHTIVFCRRK